MIMESFFIYFCPFMTAVFAFVGDPEVFRVPPTELSRFPGSWNS
ncbi:MAG: hypothetical protein ACLQO7_12460 [Candidatus Bathyarchaeia archaeon]